MATLFGIIMGLGMLIPVARSAATYDDDTKKVQQDITDAQHAHDDAKASIDKIIAEQAGLDQNIIQDIDHSLDQTIVLQDKLENARASSAVRFRTLQLTGILLISLIFFLYILKAFGFLNDINQWFLGLFRSKN